MTPVLSHAENERNDGFIIIAVLWILGALATLAIVYSLYVHQTAAAFVDHDERLEAQALAMSGIELAAYRITETDRRPSLGRFSFRQGSAAVGVLFAAENGRIDLNFAPKEVLAGLFIGLGANDQDAVGFADRIVAWRTPLANGATDTEAPIYQSAGKSYVPRHAPFQSIEEVKLVTGLAPTFVDRALTYLTVYSGKAGVNVLAAPDAIIAALPGITPDRVRLLLGARDAAAPQNVIQGELGAAATFVDMAPSDASRVTVDMRFTSGRRIRTEAIVLVHNGDAEPYRVLRWRDEELSSDARNEGTTPR